MAAADLGVFSDEAFDPKRFINAACDANRDGEQPLERCVGCLRSASACVCAHLKQRASREQ